MRFFVAKGAPQNDGGFFGGVRTAEVPLEAGRSFYAGVWTAKAAAEPPHSKSSGRSGLRAVFTCGARDWCFDGRDRRAVSWHQIRSPSLEFAFAERDCNSKRRRIIEWGEGGAARKGFVVICN
jgi:hypothetical protein